MHYDLSSQDYVTNDCYGLSVGRLTAWDRLMFVPVTFLQRGGRDKVGIRARFFAKSSGATGGIKCRLCHIYESRL